MPETVTIRPTVPKSVLEKVSGGNINRWVNSLIEAALEKQPPDSWEAFFKRPRRKVRYCADEVRGRER
ncbi:MAG: hypothetical protein ACK45B_02610 [Limisphaerales bacterium]